jgi:hypothetical protein
MFIIAAIERIRQKGHEFEIGLGYGVSQSIYNENLPQKKKKKKTRVSEERKLIF